MSEPWKARASMQPEVRFRVSRVDAGDGLRLVEAMVDEMRELYGLELNAEGCHVRGLPSSARPTARSRSATATNGRSALGV